MSAATTPRAVVDAYVAAMNAGPPGAGALAELFAEDAVYAEPFSALGRSQTTHAGIVAIRAFIRESAGNKPPDMRIALDRVDVDGERIRAEWTCTAELFGGPMRGYDVYIIRAGKIARLDTTLTERPPLFAAGEDA